MGNIKMDLLEIGLIVVDWAPSRNAHVAEIVTFIDKKQNIILGIC
jgi:hypothetical protein